MVNRTENALYLYVVVITEFQRVSKLAMLVSISAVKRRKTELSSLEVLLQKSVFELLVRYIKLNKLNFKRTIY